MSTYEVCPAHILYLVNLGRELKISCVIIDGQPLHVELTNPADRRVIASALFNANYDSTSLPEQFDAAGLGARIGSSGLGLRTLPEVAQALQWVRSYCYQASSAPSWPGSAARGYTDQLRDSLEIRIIGFFNTQWSYGADGLLDSRP